MYSPMISSELPEVLGMSDRILVRREGVVGEVENSNAVILRKLMKLAIGGKKPRNKMKIKSLHQIMDFMGLNCFVRFLQSYYL